MSFIEIIKSVVFGIVEGITEWLPVSSTGHLILLNDLLPLNTSEEFFSMFLVVIQLGAILAVIVSFFRKMWPFSSYLTDREKKKIWQNWLKVIIGCIPAGIAGFLLNDFFNVVKGIDMFFDYFFLLVDRWQSFGIVTGDKASNIHQTESIASTDIPEFFCRMTDTDN